MFWLRINGIGIKCGFISGFNTESQMSILTRHCVINMGSSKFHIFFQQNKTQL